ncbi:unnamed protein product [Caenorhabditis auriculariae]|uniref:Coiled-coil domain-containing protein n=1 Tax=Caenorhabditis auriculariae TaxID=2777116 RepID=A0A8S1H7T9_9PELO|nr:unnamed protein product [Caenorhabditis auriculariae]
MNDRTLRITAEINARRWRCLPKGIAIMPREEEQLPTFSEIQSRLRSGEDFNLAHRLQEEEFNNYYSHNRTVNGTVVTDRQKTREEQLREDEAARAARRAANEPIVLSDEELAWRLQQDFYREESEKRRLREEQLRQDELLARRLSDAVQPNQPIPMTSSNSTAPGPAPLNSSGDLIDFSDDRVSTVPITTFPPDFPAPTVNTSDYQNMTQPMAPMGFSASNPFIGDVQLLAGPPMQPPPIGFVSEFGLPPPSNIAMGRHHL